MVIKIYKTKQDQEQNTPLIYKDVKKIIDQTTDNEIDFLIGEKWHNLTNRNNNYLIIIEDN